VRALQIILFAGGALGLFALVSYVGAESIASALTRITVWQFVLICLLYGVNVVIDTLAWRYTLARDRAPFHRLLAARCAGEAVNVITALASVGGEAIKAWLLRREIPYEESVPSLVLAKTAEVLAQALMLATAILIAWTTGTVGPALLTAMGYLLLVEVLGVGGFVWVQMAGVVGKTGRILSWAGVEALRRAQRLDVALRGFYRDEWRRFLLSMGLHFAGGLVGVVEALLILHSLKLPGSLIMATIIDALWSAVRFATFFVPASLGPLEGAIAAAFGVVGFGASAGLAFTIVRRARQVVWIGLGVVILMAMNPSRSRTEERVGPVQSGAD
jgi:uncharacterized membrane protein YbhN (UPF0104 family)